MKRRIKMRISTKMMVFVMITTILVFFIVGLFVAIRINRIAYDDAVKIAQNEAQKTANNIKAELELDLGFARALAHSLYIFTKYDSTELDSIFFDAIKYQTTLNPRYMTVWYSTEYWGFVPGYDKMYGRRSITAYMKNGLPMIQIERKNLNGDILTSEYYKSKKCNCELIIDPYVFQLEGIDVLATTISVPIRKNGIFAGLGGVDLDLGKFQETIEKIKPYNNTTVFLLSNNSTIIAHSNTEFVKKKFNEIYPEDEQTNSIMEKVLTGKSLTYTKEINGERYLNIIATVDVGNMPTPWAVGISVPEREIMGAARKTLVSTVFVFLSSLIVLGIVIWLIAKSITQPIQKTTQLLNDLAQGDIDKTKKLYVTTGDEIEKMAKSVSKVIDGLNITEEFAREIGKGNLDAEFKLLGEKDILGKSLLEMQKSLKHANQVEIERKSEEEKQNWATQGMAKFGEILRENNDNLNELSYNIIKNLVNYTGSVQGGVFVLNDNDKENPIIEMTACFAYDRRKFLEKQIVIGEGLVGRCFQEGKSIYMTQLPKDYINITSGLGKENPRCLLIVPLKVNDDILGVIEIASFRVFEKHHIEFIEKVASSIASTISSVRINIRTAELLAKSQQQAEEMSAQEEEMRQNMEELQATQEEMERKRVEQEQIQEILRQDKSILDALLQNSPDLIYQKDLDGRYVRISNSLLSVLSLYDPDDAIGRTDFDLLSSDETRVIYHDEQEVLRSKKPIINKIITRKFSDGTEHKIANTILPLIEDNDEIIGVLSVGKILTDIE